MCTNMEAYILNACMHVIYIYITDVLFYLTNPMLNIQPNFCLLVIGDGVMGLCFGQEIK